MSRTGTIIVEGEAYDGGQPGFDTHRQSSIGRSSIESFEVPTPYTGAETPRPLLGPGHVLAEERDLTEISRELERIASHRSATPHMGDVMQTLARTISGQSHDIRRTPSQRPRPSNVGRDPSRPGLKAVDEFEIEASPPPKCPSQGVPPELGSFAAEVVFVLVCSAGQLLFAWLLGDVNVCQAQFQQALAIRSTQLPWLVGAFNIANGLSVMVSGSLTDLAPPKYLMVGAFAWLALWNLVGAFSLSPSRSVLFFVVRAMQGLAVGTLVSGSMSILGRVYSPGLRKTKVFSCMAAMAPFGFWLGALQGGALSSHLPWIFGSNAMLCALACAAAYFTIPDLKPAADASTSDPPSLRQFDYVGALLAVSGSIILLFGLTQGSAAGWPAWTYSLVIAGILVLAGFVWAEGRVARPLVPNHLWKIKGFAPLMGSYFLGFGAYIAWQFYALQFFIRIQHASPIRTALYLLPNALVGVLATYIVSRVMHIVPGHWLFVVSMVSFGLGPAFFLPQTANTSYWALSMPGIALCTFGPDLSFAAASIFVTSRVPRSYQGSAGSLLMTIQNLSAAIVTSLADAIGTQVDNNAEGEVGLHGLRAIWWFALGAALTGVAITVIGVRIPKEEDKEHVT